MLFKNRTFKKNSERLLNICKELIENYEKDTLKPTCKFDLLELVKNRVNAAKEEISEWKDYDTDYIKISHTLLAHATFDLLASGKYHIYAGVLNPNSCAENLMIVYKSSMEYGLKNNMLDEQTKNEQYDYLLKCIADIG